jgi:hypothetical protein
MGEYNTISTSQPNAGFSSTMQNPSFSTSQPIPHFPPKASHHPEPIKIMNRVHPNNLAEFEEKKRKVAQMEK